MNPITRHFRTLYSVLKGDYFRIFRGITEHGVHHLDVLYRHFQRSIEHVLHWTDINAANKLRSRVNDPVVLTQGSIADLDQLRAEATSQLSVGDVPDEAWRHKAEMVDQRIANQTPWLAAHREETNPFVAERAKMIADIEKEFVERRADIIEQKPEIPIYRLETFRRGALSEMAEMSQQIQLADPEIGEHFPYAFYFTRDDQRVRPTHRAMNGFVGLRTAEIWPHIVPPCGYNCRCACQFLTRRQAIERGWMDEDGTPRWEVKWPNSAARRNYESGLFPEWKTPRYWAATGEPSLI